MNSASEHKGWQQSGKQYILEHSFDHYQVTFAIKSNRPSKEYMIKRIREDISDEHNTKRFKEFNKDFLFSWTESGKRSDIYISETDKIRIKERLNEDVDMNWVENAIIRGNQKSITLTDRDNNENVLSFSIEKDSKVFLKIKNKYYKNPRKVLKLSMELENGRRKIYKLPKLDLALHMEVDYSKLNNQDVDNVQKTVLDALKRDNKDSSWNFLYEDDAQIVRILCWKTKKEEDINSNMEALTISYRLYKPEKQMCMIMLNKPFGARGLSGCKDDIVSQNNYQIGI